MKSKIRLLLLFTLVIFGTTMQTNEANGSDFQKSISENIGAFADQNLDLESFEIAKEEVRLVGTGPTISEFRIYNDAKRSLIWTDWFLSQKGEVRLRIEVVVWKGHVRFEVWQNTGMFFETPEKTVKARLLEKRLTENFYRVLRQNHK